MMWRSAKRHLLVIDLIGAIGVGACLFVSSWLFFVQSERTREHVRAATLAVNDAGDALVDMRVAMERQQRELAASRTALEAGGKLPARVPSESYFQTLSSLAMASHVRVLQQRPLSSANYPGLVERRFAYDVSGTMPNISLFLRAIEQTDYWADVSYLSIQSAGAEGRSDGSRLAELTLSLFAAPPDQTPIGDG